MILDVLNSTLSKKTVQTPTMADNSSFMKIANIDQKAIDVVSGYIRQCQKLLPKNNIYYTIPSLVEQMCITYYWIHEYFTVYGDNITLDKINNIASSILDEYNIETIYGNIIIDDKPIIYKWIFKILKLESIIIIGIDSSNKQFCNGDYATKRNTNSYYSYGSDGLKFGHNESEQFEVEGEYGYCFKTGDIVIMELNVFDKTLGYYINNKYFGIAFDNIDFKNRYYNIGVMFVAAENSIQLTEFNQIHINN